ncbi:MAG TPA: response regulator [Candidatus Bilamarchaeum sp.]|nr:response regulator [Candidatus Bilamarchaeum sp.]
MTMGHITSTRVQTVSGKPGQLDRHKPEPDKIDGMQERKNSKIILVDDEPMITRSISRIIGRGFECRVFDRPKEAIESYKSEGADVVISDFDMKSDIDGLGLLREIKSHDPEARVIVMSGRLDAERRESLFSSGAYYALEKPFDAMIMSMAVNNALEGRRAKSSRILVVDDSRNISELLSEQLRESGHDAQVAADGQEGCSKFNAGDFDLVISDVRMPGMDGIEMLKSILGADPGAKVVMMSGDQELSLSRELQEAGAFAFIKKPFNLEELRVVLDGALG